VSILLGNGDGTFQPHLDYQLGFVPGAIGVTDLNLDGNQDLAEGNSSSGVITILLGNGNGTFRLGPQSPIVPQPDSIGIGDFNQDGSPDLLVGTFANTGGELGGTYLVLGNGDGTFQTPIQYQTGNGSYLILTDLNGDGSPDAVISGTENNVTVLLNQR
jgi:hypothetical protein